MPGEFKDKIVVVSGGSRGIGRGDRARIRARGRADRAGLVVEQNLAAAAKAVAAEGPSR